MGLHLKQLFSSLPTLKQGSENSTLRELYCGFYKYVKLRLWDGRKFMSNKEGGQALSSGRNSFKVGQKINGFLVEQIEPVPELQLTAIKLVHEATGGQYLHIDREDSNNAFSVMFRTTPRDSTGLPHILEHTTLCGSEKFPCRDPFFKMLNRSLATFMNAITAPDYTLYPFSTQNPKDFQNLMSVYYDAVFKPRLKELDFQQEGWRLEHENPEDPNTPIILKGVVYNEMKGVFADNQNIFEYALQTTLLPSHTYGVCSGGDPADIPSLTYEDLKDFHQNYYSPFNTKYYTYGNFPLEDHLEFLNKHYLEKLKLDFRNRVTTVVPEEKKWTKPVRKHIKCRVDPLAPDKNKQSSIAISVLCCSITDIDECFLLKVLTQLLVSGPNSAFYKTLIEPNIGAGFSPATGYESQTRDTFFTVGLQGVSENDFEKIIELYETTIDDVIAKGFKNEHLEAVLHTIELNLKHQTSDFGLGLIFSVAPIWNHDGNVVDYLKVETQMEKFKENLAKDPEYLQKAVAKYFKNNNHKLILTMSPDANYSEEEKKKEEKVLKKKLDSLTAEDKKKIFENGLKLLQEQKQDDKSCLPTLRISDLKEDVEKTKIHARSIDGVTFYVIPQPTNGITYFRGLMTLGKLSDELKSLLPLFAQISTKMGTKKYNHKDFDQLINLKTGGFDTSVHFKTDSARMDYIEDSLTISSFCLNKNLESMFDLWLELFEGLELKNLELFETLVNSHAAGLVNGVTHMGHLYAMLSAASLISPSNLLKEKASGLTYVNLMKKVAQSNLSEVLAKMVEIQNEVMTRSYLRCAVNILEGTEDTVLNSADNFIRNAPGEVKESFAIKKVSTPVSTRGLFHVLPIPVSYTAKAMVAVPYEHEDFSTLSVMSRLMSMKHLHPMIREKGGAYGSGLSLCTSGVLRFYSYRDPNPSNSHMVYDNALSWLSKGDFTNEDVDEAKLGLFQSIDAPIPPGSKGMRWFLNGILDDSLQNYRLRMMKVTKEDVIQIGEKYLGEKNVNPVGRVVIGPENKSVTANKSQNWTVLVQE